MPPDTATRTRRYLPLTGALAAAVLIALGAWVLLGGLPGPAQRAAEQAAGIGGPFNLVDGDGRAVTDQSFRGKYLLVYFGYTFCPDACPTTLAEVAGALDQLGSRADKLQPLFISVDPARDTPGVMKQYTAAFSPRIEGLTGSADQIKQVAGEYRVYYARHQTGPKPDDYTMDHSSILYVMGPDGRFLGILRADEPAQAIVTDLEKYLS